MRHFIITALTLLVGSAGAITAREMPKVEEIYLKSAYFDHPRQLLVYTPYYYDDMTAAEWDVVYVFDAHSRTTFDLVTSLLNHLVQPDDENMRGTIVVGVCSPYIKETDYSRNNDYLPEPVHDKGKGLFSGTYYGGSPNLKKFVKEELMPYMAENYRVTGRSLGIGHSLSGSWVLDAMVTDDLFDDYVAMSPNFAYDQDRLANDFMAYPFAEVKKPRFIYVSMGNEPETWVWDGNTSWGDAWARVKRFIASEPQLAGHERLLMAEFPDQDHNKVILPALIDGLRKYAAYCGERDMWLSDEEHPMHIELHGEGLTGDVFITGNQPALGDWQPGSVKMTTVSDTVKAIDVKLRLPAALKFTRGDWEHQIYLSNSPAGNHRIVNADRDTIVYRAFPPFE